MIKAVKVKEEKRREVEDIKNLIKNYKVVAIADVTNLPAFNYMKIKTSLRGKVIIKYTKKRLIKIAVSELNDKELNILNENLNGIPVLMFTNEEPFKLYQILKKNKSPASAKQGDISPKDIVIPAGATDFTPGPMIGEFGAMGIKTSVEGGKIVIKNDKLLVKAGEEINFKQAELMGKLKIQPMEIGLNLVLTYKDGEVLNKGVLDIDTEAYENNFMLASSESVSLAMVIGYICKETIELLIKKAAIESESLANKSNFMEKIKEFIKNEVSINNEIVKTEENHNKIENKEETSASINNIGNISDETMRKAEENLRNLTNKKIKGEI